MDVEVENPHDHVAHRTGHKWLDKVLPISALFVSFLSILIAYHHGEVMQDLVRQNERLVQANSLPYLQLYGSNSVNAGSYSAIFSASNEGIGPAEIRSVQVLVDGKPVSSYGQILRECCGIRDYSNVSTSTLLGRMIRPGAAIQYINMTSSGSERDRAFLVDRARQADRIETRLCYCSVFDECWTVTSRGMSPPARVDQCTRPEPQYRT
ncbi:hypothetical protein H9L13_01840 [Sphingomonas lutea]|uniref:Uncharacterized protein n=1 Tax=Sphingomonas lutea TaxID=1045317 RepID=A0A7G9SIN5_9SPHN|nr:hypothetical protein [Sphingomonas lutea]QNN67710.1 hypothetical protein H9L13_01840 [Sphingomonas lutea]